MRRRWFLPGMVLMLFLLFFLYVPIPSSEVHSIGRQSPLGPLKLYCPQIFPSPSPSSSLCLSGESPLGISWSGGNASTWVEILPCRTFDCTEINTSTTAPPSSYAWSLLEKGASGTISFWVLTNESLIVLTNSIDGISVTVMWDVMPIFNFPGEVFTLFGIALSVIGLVLPEERRVNP